MPVSQLIQSASWFHRRSSHDGQSVAVFLSPGVSSRTDLHNKSHELGKKGTSCSTCRKTFDKFSDIMDHIEKPCGKNDARKKASSSSSAKEYVCDICSKRFSRKAYLIEHQVGSLTRFLKRLMRIMTNPHFIDCYSFLLVWHVKSAAFMSLPQNASTGTPPRDERSRVPDLSQMVLQLLLLATHDPGSPQERQVGPPVRDLPPDFPSGYQCSFSVSQICIAQRAGIVI